MSLGPVRSHGPEPTDASAGAARREFAVRLAMVAAAVAIALVLYELKVLLLLLFAAALLAIVMHAAADPLVDRFGMRRAPALVASATLTAATIMAMVLAFGAEIAFQLDLALDHLPAAADELPRRLARLGIPSDMLTLLREQAAGERVALWVAGGISEVAGLVAAGVLVIVTGVYLAAQPSSYIDGGLALLPADRRIAVRLFLVEISVELKHWLVAQLALMAIVGTLTGLGAWALGLPAPLALGLIAGMLEIVPYVGPILTTLPACALGLAVGIEAAGMMLVWIFLVQQLEGLVLTPLILKRAVRLSPAVSLLALIGAGALFGPAGVVLATPGSVVGYVAYRRYVGRRGRPVE